MVERPHTDPLPPAHHALDGRPPLPDGLGIPQPPRPPQRASWYERARVIAVLFAVLAAVVIAALR